MVALLGCSRTGLKWGESTDDGKHADICVQLPVDGSDAIAELTTDARLRRADVFFLLDTTGSMRAEIDTISEEIRDEIAPLIGMTFPDVEYGVGGFSDFPLEELGYGAAGDSPFTLYNPMSSDLYEIQSAIDRIVDSDGNDLPESQIEALYQLVTGQGLGNYVAPSVGCPSGGFGAACFRQGARPVVLLFTDAPFHDGPRGILEYQYLPSAITPAPHSYSAMVASLSAQTVSVIGLWSGEEDDQDRQDLEILAADTGALGSDGTPLVFDIGERGERLSTSVVRSLKDFASAAFFNVDVVAEDPYPGDGIDATSFVSAIIPISATPADGVDTIDVAEGRFVGVQAGTTLVFQIQLRNGVVVPGAEPQRISLRLVFRGDQRFELDKRLVDLVIPAQDGRGCDALTL